MGSPASRITPKMLIGNHYSISRMLCGNIASLAPGPTPDVAGLVGGSLVPTAVVVSSGDRGVAVDRAAAGDELALADRPGVVVTDLAAAAAGEHGVVWAVFAAAGHPSRSRGAADPVQSWQRPQ